MSKKKQQSKFVSQCAKEREKSLSCMHSGFAKTNGKKRVEECAAFVELYKKCLKDHHQEKKQNRRYNQTGGLWGEKGKGKKGEGLKRR